MKRTRFHTAAPRRATARRLRTLALVIAAVAMASPLAGQASMSDEAAAYLTRAIDAMEEQSIKRGEIDWPSLRARAFEQAAGARTTADVHDAIRFALREIADGHSFLYTPGASSAWEEMNADAPTETASELIDGRFGYLLMPGFMGSSPEENLAFAADFQARIGTLEVEGACGWVLDLRGNIGGNMWPMLAGVGPILGDGEAGRFVSAEASVPWFYRDGIGGTDGNQTTRVSPAHRLADPTPPVAVLTGGSTASSGEAIAVSFRERPNARSFGGPTAGASTANQTVWLGDGALLFLTVATFADRTGTLYGDEVVPDVIVEAPEGADGDAVLEAALEWLRSTPECVGR